ncbi:MAG TPA: KH domain-containing protein, partial [Anaerolineae bacterium]|nr:KH domain-containing protein [Anaerolineae bacterium]
MKEFVEYVVKNLVDHPDQVVVTEFRNEDTLVLELQVAPDDMGRVIGKGGRVANSLRS